MSTMAPGSFPAGDPDASALPSHPFWPRDAAIPGYVANTLSTPTILAIFAGALGTVLLLARRWAGSARPRLSGGETATVLWFVTCGFIHLVMEGYFALNFRSIPGHTSILGQAWKEYSLSDSRYLTRDAFITCMEAVTALLWGPLSLVVAACVVHSHPLRHPLQLVVSLGQLYGDVLYYLTFAFQKSVGNVHYCRPEPYYFYAYFVFLNAFWIVVPSVLVFRSVRESARVFAAVRAAEAKRLDPAAKKSD